MRLFVRIRYNLKNIVMNHLDGVWLFPVEKPWKRQKAAQLPSGSLQLSYGSIWLQKTRKFRSISSIFAASKKRCDPAKTPDFSYQCFNFITWKNALFMRVFTVLIIEFGSAVSSDISLYPLLNFAHTWKRLRLPVAGSLPKIALTGGDLFSPESITIINLYRITAVFA